ncbi:hypothetical protein J4526_01795 [Desulfurococcaceae archaeon MEX13E-LK6-19]|nr:hypothetical protein J4526_01795 [Desulfurococcaceae archaeon MEX13E-LK6-19]
MPRRIGTNILPWIILGLIMLAIVLIPTIMIYNIYNQVTRPLQGLPLVHEIPASQVQVTVQTLSLEPGQVYELQLTSDNSLVFTKTNRILTEDMTLEQTTLSSGDVIAPHLYDWLFPDGYMDWIAYDYTETISGSFVVEARASVFDTNIRHVFNTRARSGVANYDYSFDFKFQNGNRIHGDIGNGTTWLTTVADVYPFYYETHRFYNITYEVYETGYKIYVDGELKASGTYDVSTPLLTDVNHYPIVGGSIPTLSTVYDRVFYGYISYVRVKQGSTLKLLLDPIAFNGTHYFDIVSGAVGTVTGDVQRVPAEHTWLWLIKSLETDGKLHIKFVPPGAVLRITYNDQVYEWRIDGKANAAGLIEDYAIDLLSVFGTTTLSNAKVELIWTNKVRFYAPPGFTVKVSNENLTIAKRVPENASYVDIALEPGVYTVELLADRQVEPHVSLMRDNNYYVIVVRDENYYALANATVVVYANGVEVARGVTDATGRFIVPASELNNTDTIRVEVLALSAGTYYTTSRTIELTQAAPATQTPSQNQPVSSGSEYIIAIDRTRITTTIVIILAIMFLAVLVIAFRKR